MKVIALILLVLTLSQAAFAGDETQTLPRGIFGVRLNNVFVTGTDNQFGPNGQKASVGEVNQSSLTAQANNQAVNGLNSSPIGQMIYQQILKILQSSPTLQSALNQFQQSVDLGQMRVNVVPTTSVTSPTLLYGVTNWWTTIVNAPYIKTSMRVSWQYVPGASTAAFDNGASVARVVGLNVPTSNQFVSLGQLALVQKGYNPLASEDKEFMGDIYVMNLFNLGRLGNLSFGTMNTISLPTGPQHDPNDLLDVGSFHHSFVEQEFTSVYAFSKRLKTYVSGSVRYNLPEQTQWRVPANEADLDPALSQTANVNRQIGLGTMVEGGIKYRLLPRFEFKGGLQRTTKAADSFSGTQPGAYDLIERTYPYNASQSVSYKLGITYDPLSNYRPGSIPLMVDLNYQEIFAGENTPAIKQLTLALSTFF